MICDDGNKLSTLYHLNYKTNKPKTSETVDTTPCIVTYLYRVCR